MLGSLHPQQRWMLWVLVPVGGFIAVGTFFGALAFLGDVASKPLEILPEERALVLDIASLASWTDYAPDVAQETTTKLEYADGSIEIEYEYEIPDDVTSIYLSYSVSLEPSLDEAASDYDMMWQATSIGLTITNGSDLIIDERNDLFRWGDDSRFGIIRVGEKGAGNLFVGRLGHRVVHCMFSGVYFEDSAAIRDLLTPALERLESFNPS